MTQEMDSKEAVFKSAQYVTATIGFQTCKYENEQHL